MINGIESSTIDETSPLLSETEQTNIIALLATRFPEYADAISSNERLAGALAAVESATPLNSQDIVDRISERELATAQRPIDVLVSRCLALIRDTAAVAEPERSLGPQIDEPEPTLDADVHTAPPQDGARLLDAARLNTMVHPPPRKRGRRESRLAIPVGADAELVRPPFAGHRYITVVGSVGGAGSTTIVVLLGQMLAMLRNDNVSAIDAAQHGGALAFRSGSQPSSTITDLLAAETSIRSLNDLGEYVDRLPTRLGIAKSLPGDAPLNADDYRRAVDLLARHFDVLITDTGTATSGEAAGPALGLADLVVVVSNPTEHGVRTSAHTFDVLESHGIGADRTILVVNGVHRRSAVRTDRFVETLSERCAAHMWLPWDRHLAVGSAVSLSQTHRSTTKAVVRLSAAVVQSMSPGNVPVDREPESSSG